MKPVALLIPAQQEMIEVLYRDTQDEIVIVAVMHLHRRPNYWLKRIR